MSIEAGLKSMNNVMPSRTDGRNRLLNKMPASDFALLAPHLERVGTAGARDAAVEGADRLDGLHGLRMRQAARAQERAKLIERAGS